MKKFRIFAVLMALCICLCCVSPSAAAAGNDIDNYHRIEYTQTGTLQSGDPVYICGTPNYDAYTYNQSTTLLAVDTDDGTWFVAIGPVGVDAFKAGVPSGKIYLFGVYAGTMNTNGMPILDIQNGYIGYAKEVYEASYSYGRYVTKLFYSNTSDAVAQGQKIVDEEAAKAQAEAEAEAAREAARKAQEEAEKAAEAAAWKKTGKMVWIPTHGGECWHTNPHCCNMVDPEKVDLGYAKYLGYRDCSKC